MKYYVEEANWVFSRLMVVRFMAAKSVVKGKDLGESMRGVMWSGVSVFNVAGTVEMTGRGRGTERYGAQSYARDEMTAARTSSGWRNLSTAGREGSR